MKFEIKTLHKDKVEPTQKFDGEDEVKLSFKVEEMLHELTDPNSDMIGFLVKAKK